MAIVELQKAQKIKNGMLIGRLNEDRSYNVQNFGLGYQDVETRVVGQYSILPNTSYREEVDEEEILYLIRKVKQQLLSNLGLGCSTCHT